MLQNVRTLALFSFYFAFTLCLTLPVFVVPRRALSTREKRTSVAEEDSDEFFEDSDSEMK